MDTRLDDSMPKPNDDGTAVNDGEVVGVAVAKGIHALQVDYASLKLQVIKSGQLLPSETPILCTICKGQLPLDGAGVLICSDKLCTATTHLSCLSHQFLDTQGQTDAMLPTIGHCPKCNAKVAWVDLVKELSLRMRGKNEIKKILAAPRGKQRSSEETVTARETATTEDDTADGSDNDLPEDDLWHELTGSSEVERPPRDNASASVRANRFTGGGVAHGNPRYRESVIEESDWDDAEIIT